MEIDACFLQGALHQILKEFNDNDINLTKIELFFQKHLL